MADLFRLKKHGTTLRTEILAGCSTFLMMAYIVVVNPAILSDAGVPFAGALLATVLVAALSSILMGLYANLPIALAPGMGINAFFAYTLVLGSGGKITWEMALTTVFVSGLLFIVLSLTSARTIIVKAIPPPLKYGAAAGIGIFLALIGLEGIGFVTSSTNTLVAFGGIDTKILLFVFGLLISTVLIIRKVPGAIVIGIVLTSLMTLLVSHIGCAYGWLAEPLMQLPDKLVALPTVDVMFKLDFSQIFTIAMIAPIFSFLFVDMFDSISTLVGVCEVGQMMDKEGKPRNVKKALLVDALSTTMAGLFGSSSGTAYIESAAGIEEGGRTGLTAVVTGLLFLPFMFLSPLLAFIPKTATAPVLVIIGTYMLAPLKQINWKNFEEALPAFLAIILIPLTYSITQGIIWGFLSYTLIKVLLGKAREIHWMLYIIDIFAIIDLHPAILAALTAAGDKLL